MSSSRLPGKVLRPILGRPMLSLHLERLRHMRRADQLVVATSVDASDDAIAALCAAESVACLRGSLSDVLDRFHQAALAYRPDHVVRLTADCPLADPELIDRIIATHLEGDHDFTSNTLTRTYPKGLDASAFRRSLLEEAWREASAPEEREHVTLYMKANAARLRIGEVRDRQDRSQLRWTVDEAADFAFVSAVFERLYAANPRFSTEDIHRLLLREPELAAINAGVGQP